MILHFIFAVLRKGILITLHRRTSKRMLHTIFNWWNYSIVDSLILVTALLTLTNSKSIASNFTILDYALLGSGGIFIGLKILSYVIWRRPIENVPALSDNTYFLGNTTLYFPNSKIHEVLLSNAEKYGDIYQVCES